MLFGKRLPADPRAALQELVRLYPRADHEKLARIFEAAIEDNLELARSLRRGAVERLISELPEAPRV